MSIDTASDSVDSILRLATTTDIPELVRLNQLLIEEERYDRSFTDSELITRLGNLLANSHLAYFILSDGKEAGYLMVNTDTEPLYIRQFYIKPEFRRRSLGKRAVFELLSVFSISELDVEVMAWNELGMKFWQGIGFHHRYNGLRLQRSS